MRDDQVVFSQWFDGLDFGPRNGFDPWEWQHECLERFIAWVEDVLATRSISASGPSPATALALPPCFTLFAGTGSGKTKMAGLMAAYLLARDYVGQVVFVCPNDSIKKQTKDDFLDCLSIDLTPYHGAKCRMGVPRKFQGYIVSYNHLQSNPTHHRGICALDRTLVIFDEVHHLGDKNGGWGTACIEAFSNVNFVVALTGTPYRSDNRQIPFVTYHATETEGLLRFRATTPDGFTYTLGRSVAESKCRKPIFNFFYGDVKLRRDPSKPYEVVSFDDEADEWTSRCRLRLAVDPASELRLDMLRKALAACRKDRRKVIIFLGGDTEGEQTPTIDAIELLPMQLEALGIGPDEYEVVTGDDDDAQDKILRFGKSDKWILVSINMVSEGTNIPEISAAIFLTSITAKQTTVQRIGRTLRLMGEKDPHQTAWLYMFADPNLLELRTELEGEIDHEVNLRNVRAAEADHTNGDAKERRKVEGMGIGLAEHRTLSTHGRTFHVARELEPIFPELRAKGLPENPAMAALYLICQESAHAAAI